MINYRNPQLKWLETSVEMILKIMNVRISKANQV